MSAPATLAIDETTEYGPDVRRIIVECEHARTRAHLIRTPTCAPLDDDDAIRLLLVKHHTEERCVCTRQLWRKFWRTELGELPLVRGAQ